MDMEDEHRPSVTRLKRDMVVAAAALSEEEVRYLVDGYYQIQEGRKRANNQVLSMKGEPHLLLGWLAEQNETLEGQIKRALQSYAESKLVGRWMMSIYGIGPVIASGLLAHIDINRAPTVGHIWSFAGIQPDMKWEKGQKRPFNAELKVLCWKAGQSFMKFAAAEECVYGHVYKERKLYEITRNDSGGNTEAAAAALTAKTYRKTTDAYKHYTAGHLPPAQIDARARRYAVKLFLSHLHTVWWFVTFGELPSAPYAIAQRDHTHFEPLPNCDLVPGLVEALRAKGWN